MLQISPKIWGRFDKSSPVGMRKKQHNNVFFCVYCSEIKHLSKSGTHVCYMSFWIYEKMFRSWKWIFLHLLDAYSYVKKWKKIKMFLLSLKRKQILRNSVSQYAVKTVKRTLLVLIKKLLFESFSIKLFPLTHFDHFPSEGATFFKYKHIYTSI